MDRLRELEIELLGLALVSGRQGESEAHLRSGREAQGERERELLDSQCPLEGARDVAVRDPADLAPLRVADPHRESRVAAHQAPTVSGRPVSVTGTSAPRLRS